MKRFLTIAAVVFVASSLAMAQGGGQRRGGLFQQGPLILTRPDVAKELKLTDKQQTDLQAMFESMRPQGGGGGGGRAGGSGGGGGGGFRGGFGGDPERAAEIDGKIKGILDDGQYKRYHELSLQQAGGLALLQEDTAKSLGLTDAQKEKIQGLRDDMMADIRDMFQNGGGGDRQAMMEEMRSLREGYSKDMLKVLTDDQNKKWVAMLGKPFKFEEPGGGD